MVSLKVIRNTIFVYFPCLFSVTLHQLQQTYKNYRLLKKERKKKKKKTARDVYFLNCINLRSDTGICWSHALIAVTMVVFTVHTCSCQCVAVYITKNYLKLRYHSVIPLLFKHTHTHTCTHTPSMTNCRIFMYSLGSPHDC